MEQTNATDIDSIRRYLLGASAPAEAERIERRLLADRAFYDEVSACEDELLDEYIGGRLAAGERESFEGIFLVAPERRQKLRFALALRRRIEESVPPSDASSVMVSAGAFAGAPRAGFFRRLSPNERAAFASVVLIASAGAVLLAVRAPWRTPAQPAAPAAVERAASVSRPDAPPAHSVPTALPNNRTNARAKIVAVALTPGLTRGAGDQTRRVEITPGVELVRLQLLITSADYASYQATVRSVEGRAVADLTSLAADSVGGAPAVVVELPASSLAPDDYRVKLSGLREGGDPELVASYFLRILRP